MKLLYDWLSFSLSSLFIMSLVQQIAEIEEEMARTQKNKATEKHIGLLKAKLAKLRREILTPKKSKGGGEGFDVT